MRLVRATATCLAFFLWPGMALADAIDGNWCADDGRNLTIDGPHITTPAGHRLNGDYQRHAFSYQVPPGESAAGATVRMTLWDEDTVHLAVGEALDRIEIWKRCGPNA